MAQYPSPNISSSFYTTGAFATSPNKLVGQCTWYVYGRIKETGLISASTLQNSRNRNGGYGIFLGNADTWDEDALAAGFNVGTTPQVGAIAVWNSINHVAFVESVGGGTYSYTESNLTPGNGVEVIVGGDYARLRSQPSTTGTILWTMPQFTLMNVVGGPVTADGYKWFQLSGNGYTGWAAWLNADLSSPVDESDYWWNITRIRRSAVANWRSSSPVFIYLSSPPTTTTTRSTTSTIRSTTTTRSTTSTTSTTRSTTSTTRSTTTTTVGPGQIDLTVVEPVTFTPSSAAPGSIITINWTEKNNGSTASSPAHNTKLFLSSSAYGTTHQIAYFGPMSVLAGGTTAPYNSGVHAIVPASIPPGNYYVTAFIDCDQGVSEANEGNNIGSSSPNRITITGSTTSSTTTRSTTSTTRTTTSTTRSTTSTTRSTTTTTISGAAFSGAFDGGAGRKYLSWFGWYNDQNWPWIWDYQFGGWLWVVDNGPQNLWLWQDNRQRWMWTRTDWYPWVWYLGDSGLTWRTF